MTERANRLIFGFSMLLCLFMGWNYAIFFMLGLLFAEGLTNWRIPIMVSRVRFTSKSFQVTDSENLACRVNYEAERMLRWVMGTAIGIGFIIFPKELWFLPWFASLNLLLAGITGICPMVMLLRRMGLR